MVTDVNKTQILTSKWLLCFALAFAVLYANISSGQQPLQVMPASQTVTYGPRDNNPVPPAYEPNQYPQFNAPAVGPGYAQTAARPQQSGIESQPGTERPAVEIESRDSTNYPEPANASVTQQGNSYGQSVSEADTIAAIPGSNMAGWWNSYISNPMRHASEPKPIGIHDLLMRAMQYSSRIRVISDSPLIQDTGIIEADADFDWVTFMEAAWNDLDEPVGSTLTTGGPPRFSNEKATFDAGIRKRTTRGAQFEVSEGLGYERSNSVFFIPNDQGTSRFTINFSQPLLRGAGRVVNTSTVVLAQLQSDVARAEFSRIAARTELDGKGCLLVVIRDLTADNLLLDRLNTSERRFQALFQGAPAALITFGARKTITRPWFAR